MSLLFGPASIEGEEGFTRKLALRPGLARAARRGEYLGELEIRTDGGPQFLAHAFAAAVHKAGLRHTVTPAVSPEHNPFAEALLGAFKEECVSHQDPARSSSCSSLQLPLESLFDCMFDYAFGPSVLNLAIRADRPRAYQNRLRA